MAYRQLDFLEGSDMWAPFFVYIFAVYWVMYLEAIKILETVLL